MLLISCYHEVDMDSYRDEDGENLLTLNSLVTPDSTVQVILHAHISFPTSIMTVHTSRGLT